MTRRLVLASTALVVVGAVSPALAATDAAAGAEGKRICVALSSGPDKEPVAPLCVWYPGR